MKLETVKTWTYAVFLIAVVFLLILGIEYVSGLEYPNIEPYVNDFAEVIEPSCENMLNSLSAKIESETTAEIVTVTMLSLEEENLEEFTNELFRKAGIGKKDKNNGVLIIIFTEDRKWRIEVGYGLEGDLPDLLTSQIAQDKLVPKLKEGDFCNGLFDTVEEMGVTIGVEKKHNFVNSDGETIVELTDWEIIVAIVVIIVIIVILALTGNLWVLLFIGRTAARAFGGGSSGGGGAGGDY